MVRKTWPLLASYNHKEYLYPNIAEGIGWNISVTRSLCRFFYHEWLVWEDTGRTDATSWMVLLYIPLCALNIYRNRLTVISQLPWSPMKPSCMTKYRISMPKVIFIVSTFSGCTQKVQQIKVFLFSFIIWFHDSKTSFSVLRFSLVGEASREM